MELSERIRDLIKDKRVTPYEIYVKTGISQSALSLVLNGKTKRMSIRNSELLSNFFNVNCEWLKSGIEPKYVISADKLENNDVKVEKLSTRELEMKIKILNKDLEETKAENLRLIKANAVLEYLNDIYKSIND